MIRWRLVSALAVTGCGALALYALWPEVLPPAPPIVIEIAVPALVAPLECPTPEPPAALPPAPVLPAPARERFGPRSCPAIEPARDPDVGTPWAEPDEERMLDDYELVGVAVSPTRHGVLAVWSASQVLVSYDDGLEFKLLPGLHGELVSVTVDCRGAVLVIAREGGQLELGIFEEQGDRIWRSLPPFVDEWPTPEPPGLELVAGGGLISVSGERGRFELGAPRDPGDTGSRAALIVSRDGGRRWRHLEQEPNIQSEGQYVDSIDNRGVITVVEREGDCMYNGTVVYRGRVSGKKLSYVNVSQERIHDELTVANGWAYGLYECEGSALCATKMAGLTDWRPVAGLEEIGDDDPPEPSVLLGARAVVQHGRRVYRLRGLRAEAVGAALPAGSTMLVVDSSGRVLGFDRYRRLIRWSSRRGVRVLAGEYVCRR